MVVPHLTREMWNIGKVGRAGVVVHAKGADSAGGYPFLSDVKIQTRPEQEWSLVTLLQRRLEYGGDRGEISWEKYCGKIKFTQPLTTTSPHILYHRPLNPRPLPS